MNFIEKYFKYDVVLLIFYLTVIAYVLLSAVNSNQRMILTNKKLVERSIENNEEIMRRFMERKEYHITISEDNNRILRDVLAELKHK